MVIPSYSFAALSKMPAPLFQNDRADGFHQIDHIGASDKRCALAIHRRETESAVITVQIDLNLLEILIVQMDGQDDFPFLCRLLVGEFPRGQGFQSGLNTRDLQRFFPIEPGASAAVFLGGKRVCRSGQGNINLPDIREIRPEHLRMPEIVIGCGHQLLIPVCGDLIDNFGIPPFPAHTLRAVLSTRRLPSLPQLTLRPFLPPGPG